jgi:hypothetical protein
MSVLVALVIFTIAKGALWALLIPPFHAPDEPSHFAAMMQIRTSHMLPVIVMPSPTTMTAPPSTPIDPATARFIAAAGYSGFEAMPYESSQPPLFYVVAAALTGPLGEDRQLLLFAARLTSVLWGAGAVVALWIGVRALWPGNRLIEWGAPLALTLHPEFTFVTSTLGNESAALCCGAAVWALWARGLRAAPVGGLNGWHWAVGAGLLTAVGMLAKLTLICTVPATLLWLWWLAGASPGRAKRWSVNLTAAGATGLALAGPWLVRNIMVYGEPSGTRAILAIYRDIAIEHGGPAVTPAFLVQLTAFFLWFAFMSFWATYGWFHVLLPIGSYFGLLILGIFGTTGLLRWWRKGDRVGRHITVQRRLVGLSVITLTAALADLALYDGTVDFQPQGRYLFVGLAPAMLLCVIGLRYADRRPTVHRLMVGSFFALLVLMQIWSLPMLATT